MVRRLLGQLLPVAGAALAVWLSTLIIPDIKTFAQPGWPTVGTVVLVALLFGLVNLTVKPIAKLVGCGIYVITFGLIAIVVNGGLLLLTSWIAGKLHIPFHVGSFWPGAILGALFIGIVSWILDRVSDLLTKKRSVRVVVVPPQPPRQQYPYGQGQGGPYGQGRGPGQGQGGPGGQGQGQGPYQPRR